MFEFVCACDPVPKGRPRLGRGGRVFTPKKTADYEAFLKMEAAHQWQSAPVEFPLECRFVAVLPIPKSWSKKKREQASRGELFHVSKPDVDNLAKSVLDALNGVVYLDDAQIVRLDSVKRYGDEPGVSVYFWRAV